MANDDKILSTPQGWRLGELVAHEAEKSEAMIQSCFFPAQSAIALV
jgi:hypothetical protein